MEAELKLTDFKIEIIEYEDESVKLKSLIDQAVTRRLIIYKDWNFLLYSINILQLDTDFFNLFLGFLAKPVLKINKEIMDLILWHTKNIISDENVKLHKYLWNWWAYLMQKQEEKPQTILVLKSTLQQCEKN